MRCSPRSSVCCTICASRRCSCREAAPRFRSSDEFAPDGRTIAVAGQIDRLAVTPEAVLIADYKTNRPAPRTVEDVPKPYVTQLALYRAVLAGLYPERPVRAALVWTEVPDLMELAARGARERARPSRCREAALTRSRAIHSFGSCSGNSPRTTNTRD